MSTSIPKVSHRFQTRMLVPWAAMSGYNPLDLKKGNIITTSDGSTCKIERMEEIHIMSNEALTIVQSLYKIGQVQFMREWYDRLPDISSMWFLDLTVKKVKVDVDTEGIPE